MTEFDYESPDGGEDFDDVERELYGSAREASVFLLPFLERNPFGVVHQGLHRYGYGKDEGGTVS